MKTYPHQEGDGIIDLVRKDDHDAVVADLKNEISQLRTEIAETQRRNEQSQNVSLRMVAERDQLRASLTSWQAMAERLATALKEYSEPVRTASDGGSHWCLIRSNPNAHQLVASINEALAAYESAKKGNLPDTLTEAVKRMEAVAVHELWEIYATHDSPAAYKCMGAVRARLISAAKGKQP